MKAILAAFLTMAAVLVAPDSAVAASCAQLASRLSQAQAANHKGNMVIARMAMQRQGCGGAAVPGRSLRSRAVVLPQFGMRPPARRDTRRSSARPAAVDRPGERRSRAGERRGRSASRERSSRNASRQAGSGPTYRTWCVRTCDGYYFPISFSTKQSQFATDEAACQQLCPGASAELFVHPTDETDRAMMESVSGQPYTALPTAFQYRTSRDPSCSCGGPGGDALAILQTKISVDDPESEPLAPLPKFRIAPGEDPETIANLAGDFRSGLPGETVAVAQHAPGSPRQILASQQAGTELLASVSTTAAKDDDLQLGMLLLVPKLMVGHLPAP